MRVKQGVILINLQPEMRKVMGVVDSLWLLYGHEAVITAGTDAFYSEAKNGEQELIHSPDSLHPFGFALDFRTRYFTVEIVIEIEGLLRERLGEDYDVVVHTGNGQHIHVEYQKHKKKIAHCPVCGKPFMGAI